jgi:hypothetical protein
LLRKGERRDDRNDDRVEGGGGESRIDVRRMGRSRLDDTFISACTSTQTLGTYHRTYSDLSSLILSLQPTLKLLLLLLSNSISILRSGYLLVFLLRSAMNNLRAWIDNPAGLDTLSLCDDPSSNARLNIELAMKGSSGGFEAGTAFAYPISPVPDTRDLTYLSLNIDIYLGDMRSRWAFLCVGIHLERCYNRRSGKELLPTFSASSSGI